MGGPPRTLGSRVATGAVCTAWVCRPWRTPRTRHGHGRARDLSLKSRGLCCSHRCHCEGVRTYALRRCSLSLTHFHALTELAHLTLLPPLDSETAKLASRKLHLTPLSRLLRISSQPERTFDRTVWQMPSIPRPLPGEAVGICRLHALTPMHVVRVGLPRPGA